MKASIAIKYYGDKDIFSMLWHMSTSNSYVHLCLWKRVIHLSYLPIQASWRKGLCPLDRGDKVYNS